MVIAMEHTSASCNNVVVKGTSPLERHGIIVKVPCIAGVEEHLALRGKDTAVFWRGPSNKRCLILKWEVAVDHGVLIERGGR